MDEKITLPFSLRAAATHSGTTELKFRGCVGEGIRDTKPFYESLFHGETATKNNGHAFAHRKDQRISLEGQPTREGGSFTRSSVIAQRGSL